MSFSYARSLYVVSCRLKPGHFAYYTTRVSKKDCFGFKTVSNYSCSHLFAVRARGVCNNFDDALTNTVSARGDGDLLRLAVRGIFAEHGFKTVSNYLCSHLFAVRARGVLQ